MDEHLSTERLSMALDEPAAGETAMEHLEECRECARELERLRRMRMALSGMGEKEPPAGEWEEIEEELRASGLPGREADASPALTDWSVGRPWTSGWAARAAAAVLVFGVGLAAGLQFDPGGSPDGGRTEVAEAGPEGAAGNPTGALVGGAEETLEGGLAGLLTGSSEGRSVNPVEDPVMAAEELARLDALARAVRERLREDPADPELNDLLFQIADRKESLTQEFGRAAQLVSLDYR